MDDRNLQGASLILFVAGEATRSRRARANLTRALARLAIDRRLVREVDLLEHPEQTVTYGIFATPALLRVLDAGRPSILYGDLSEPEDLEAFLSGLGDAQPEGQAADHPDLEAPG